MARYEFTNEYEGKRPLRISDCSQGDLVSIPEEGINLGIITDSPDVGYYYCAVIDFDGGELMEIHESTPCRKYTGTLQLDNKLFEEFC